MCNIHPYIDIMLLRLRVCANCRAIGQLFMEIFYFKELGDIESVVMNVVYVLI